MMKPFNIHLFRRYSDNRIVACAVIRDVNDWMYVPVFLRQKHNYQEIVSANYYFYSGILEAFRLAVKYDLIPRTKNIKNILLFIY